MNEISTYKNNLQLFSYASDVAKEYGLFSRTVVHSNYTGKPDVYVVFGVEPIRDDVNPVEIINRNNRNSNLFYPESHAVNITQVNPLMAWEEICGYLAHAEFMCELFDEFQVPLPKKIRVDELTALVTFYCGRDNPSYDMDTRKNYAKGLRDFFKHESSKGKFFNKWQEFYRSELFDGDKSFVSNFLVFLKRNEPETKLDVLLESNFELKKVYVPEHYYDEFRKTIKSKYPDVKYSVSDLKVVDKGIITDPKSGERVVTQFGKCVTDKEFDMILEKRFADEGFDCLDGLNTSYYEGRDVFYKASDENIIASVLNNIRFRWAKCPAIETLQARGKIEQIDIPVSQMRNFYVGMKQFGVPFTLDTDTNHKPQIDSVHVLYNACDGEVVGKLVAGLTLASLTTSHIHSDDIRFQIDLNQVDSIINNAKQKANDQIEHNPTEFIEGKTEHEQF